MLVAADPSAKGIVFSQVRAGAVLNGRRESPRPCEVERTRAPGILRCAGYKSLQTLSFIRVLIRC